MGLLHEPDRDATFALTPDYDAVLADWANINPDRVHPRFTADECAAFTFRWPATKARAANGRFTKG